MFDRATITLGIGPHSSLSMFLSCGVVMPTVLPVAAGCIYPTAHWHILCNFRRGYTQQFFAFWPWWPWSL